jgi:hypothetical protein
MVTFKINGIDISNDVLLNTFNYMSRADEVFGTGSFSFESKTISENISPYSILTINNKPYCCSSEATYHFGSGTWFHNVSVIEATSLLSRFLVGSKAFSITGTNKFDSDKINILFKLVNDKYGVNIKWSSNARNIFNKQIEYVFTAGTTLFDALDEISKQYNIRFYVSKVEGNDITIDYVELYNLSVLNFEQDKILSLTKTQNAETYCKYLETEATNVIETTQTSIIRNIFPTANEIKLNEDSYVVKTPTPIYNLKKLIANVPTYLEVRLELGAFNDYNYNEGTTKTYLEWVFIFPVLGQLYTNILSKYISQAELYETEWIVDQVDWHFILQPKEDAILKGLIYPYDITSHILSKEQYELLEDKDKPDYAYYTFGSNVIDGFNIYYKNDFWNDILEKNNNPFLKDLKIRDTTHSLEQFKGGYFYTYSIYNDYADASPVNISFDVEYYPIVNPYLINVKQDTPLNETSYKPYSISYNKSSNYVDFDKISNSMNIDNQSTGKVELIVEYDTTDSSFGFDLKRRIVLNGKDWYIISSQTTYSNGKQNTRFNLVSNYNKIADVIALNSQYNTLKNPLENIIERPIFIETNTNFTLTRGKTYLKITTYSGESNSGKINDIYFLPITMMHNDDIYLYFEMLDQYSAGTNAIKVSNNVYKVNDVAYVNNKNELLSISITLIEFRQLSQEDIQKLPAYDKESYVENETIVESKLIYKDAREKLTFTIKANNCIIK